MPTKPTRLVEAPDGDVLGRVLRVLERVRIFSVGDEHEVHRVLKHHFSEAGLRFVHEQRLGRGSRVDFLVEGCVAVEVKKGKPNSTQVAAQIQRYAASPLVQSVVIVVERNLATHDHEAGGKPVRYVSLSRNWGLSL